MKKNFYSSQEEDYDDFSLPDVKLLRYYKNLRNRTYTIFGEVNDELLDLAQLIIEWNREDSEIPIRDRTPIKIIIDSPGGYLGTYRTIKSLIEISKTPIIGINIGSAYSAAAYIFLSCHERYMLKTAKLLFHRGSAQLDGRFDEIQSSAEEYYKEVNEMVSEIAKNTNFSIREIQEKINGDWYIDAQEAVRHKAATKIITNIDDIF